MIWVLFGYFQAIPREIDEAATIDGADHRRQVVSDLVAQCEALSLAFVVEPIWYPLPGEDAKSAAWQAQRVDGIIASAREAYRLGVDMLKVEFPGDVRTPEGRSAAAAACRRLADNIDVPWVILSAGVGHDEFKEQVRVACAAGASGFLAGRSIWRAATTHDPVKRRQAVREAAGRLAELSKITRENGRPFLPKLEGRALVEAFPGDWRYRRHNEP